MPVQNTAQALTISHQSVRPETLDIHAAHRVNGEFCPGFISAARRMAVIFCLSFLRAVDLWVNVRGTLWQNLAESAA